MAIIFSIIPSINMISPRHPAKNAINGFRWVEINWVMLIMNIPTIDTPVHGSLSRLIIIVCIGDFIKYSMVLLSYIIPTGGFVLADN